MVPFSVLRMPAIVVEHLTQLLLIFIATQLIEQIDVSVEVLYILGLIDDVEGGELGVIVRDDVELVLLLALEQFLVALDEEAGEVPDVVVLGVHTYFQTSVLEEIFIEDVLVEQGSLDFGFVGDVELG